MVFLGRWLFRLYVGLLAAPVVAWHAVAAAVERGAHWTGLSWRARLADRLLDKGSVLVPALVASFADDFEHKADGPGWSEAQIPKLWATCKSLAQQLGCPPPDAIHLSVEPGDCMAWLSREGSGPTRRHIALSLLDLRLATHDEGRAVIAHEIVHAGFDHSTRDYVMYKHDILMCAVIDGLVLPITLPVYLALFLTRLGMGIGAHDLEREADRKAAEVVGKNHMAKALERINLQAPVLHRVFVLVFERAIYGQRAPLRLAEAAELVFRSHQFGKDAERARKEAELDGPQHPSLPARVENVEQAPTRAGIGGDRTFIEAYPELLVVEELLTKTYFPHTPSHTRSDGSQLRRKALAARLKRR